MDPSSPTVTHAAPSSLPHFSLSLAPLSSCPPTLSISLPRLQEKIQLEAQRYQELVQEMERMKEQYEESDTFLHDSHQRKMEELAEEYNKQLRRERERYQ